MNTRMERYNSEGDTPSKSRVSKNNSLYETIKSSDLSRVRNNDNIKVIESNGKTIDIAKIRKYLEENNIREVETKRRVVVTEEPKVETREREEIKDYDINSVLENAKKSREIDYDRERYKKLRREEYDILSKLKVYEDEQKPIDEDDFNTEEKTLIDLINTVTIHKGELNLLDDLIGGEDEETTLPIEEEKSRESFVKEEVNPIEKDFTEKRLEELNKTKELVNLKEKTMELDNSFYTSSMSFSKDDFEGFDELEKSVKKNGFLTAFLLVLLVVFIIATLVVIANYVFELGLF